LDFMPLCWHWRRLHIFLLLLLLAPQRFHTAALLLLLLLPLGHLILHCLRIHIRTFPRLLLLLSAPFNPYACLNCLRNWYVSSSSSRSMALEQLL
jgi:hypothetical protein